MKYFFIAMVSIGGFEIIYGILGLLLNTPPTNEGMIYGGFANLLIVLLLFSIYKLFVIEQQSEVNNES